MIGSLPSHHLKYKLVKAEKRRSFVCTCSGGHLLVSNNVSSPCNRYNVSSHCTRYNVSFPCTRYNVSFAYTGYNVSFPCTGLLDMPCGLWGVITNWHPFLWLQNDSTFVGFMTSVSPAWPYSGRARHRHDWMAHFPSMHLYGRTSIPSPVQQSGLSLCSYSCFADERKPRKEKLCPFLWECFQKEGRRAGI